MAPACKHFKSIFSICKPPNIWWRESFRLYSQYSPSFEDPILDKDVLAEMVKDKKQEMQCIPRKAVENNRTCSVFYDDDIRKFTNHLCKKGNKALARKLVEDALTYVKHLQLRKYNAEKDEEKKKEIIISSREIFHLALKNVTPMLKVQKYKKSGSWYRVPVGVTPQLAKFMGMKWLIEVSSDKDMKVPLEKQLAYEFIAAANYEGRAVNKKLELHKLCETNRGYAHYRWG